ncbi:MAG TPA: deoxyribodipyrimidine photo-lyase [Geminicoccus sp.]|jgi:deoxyribodipyrimidine photo-lyase|uniref:cryptochrome/photolyase family protein n=1 Tax=Geminicoccus sp. TaxID=2024832 RepID=UPI002E35BCA3|nr:deoxyribodipyrimidine photo-lyase [Geminicoccus sp.]HEX2527312.1 deoxyribodipyrimidine photo-lyase [Geminicoccus sp.]
MSATGLCWFRWDLRLLDQPALLAAAEGADRLVCVHLLDERMGGAQRWWLHHSLTRLQADLQAKGQRLVLRRGDPATVLRDLVERHRIQRVAWNRAYGPEDRARDQALAEDLEGRGVEVATFNGSLGREPHEVTQPKGQPYKVYTPYAKAWFKQGELPAPHPAPDRLPPPPDSLKAGDKLASWALLPTRPDWVKGFRKRWGNEVGEAAAHTALDLFVEQSAAGYGRGRDLPGTRGTSRMSAHLRFGEISPRQVVHAARAAAESGQVGHDQLFPYLRQIVWRDFAYANLFHFPQLPTEPLRPAFRRLVHAEDPGGRLLRAWQTGRTGYPIVDAGMRELWHTGWMHNRARLIAGSFLVKDLLLPWQAGLAWFDDTLVDADPANNAMGWQWLAGCGIDATPFFRVFSPVLQGRKFDPDGAYVRRWVPELAELPDRHLHAPFEAPEQVLHEAGVTLGKTYPRPVVDHGLARDRALRAFRAMRAAA